MGANVIALARSTTQLEELRKELANLQTIQVDLKDWHNTKKALEQVPQLDGLVNNAGVAIIKPFEELSEQDFDE